MTPYTEKLTAAIAAYEAKCGLDSPGSILEALWYDYSCQSPVDDGKLQAVEEQLRPVFEELSADSSDLLFDQIADLLTGYQRAAYLEGLRTGAHLILELT